MARFAVVDAAPPDFSPTVDDLVGVARGAGMSEAKPRTIHHWRSLDLISPPVRRGREYRYPIAALGEVDGLARWRRRPTDNNLLRFARYIEAGTVGLEAALEACTAALERFRHGMDEAKSLARQGEDAIREEAEKLAKARGKRALLPHRVRMSGAERTAAVHHIFSEALDLRVDVSQRDLGQFQLERSIGLRSGRGGATRDVSELIVPVEGWRVDPDAAIEAVRTASPEAAELGRRVVETNCIWLPAVMPLFAAESKPHETPFFDIVETAFKDFTPDVYVASFASRLLRFNQRSRVLLATQLDEFHPAEMFAELLSDRSDRDYRIVRSRLRPYQRARLAIARHPAPEADVTSNSPQNEQH